MKCLFTWSDESAVVKPLLGFVWCRCSSSLPLAPSPLLRSGFDALKTSSSAAVFPLSSSGFLRLKSAIFDDECRFWFQSRIDYTFQWRKRIIFSTRNIIDLLCFFVSVLAYWNALFHWFVDILVNVTMSIKAVNWIYEIAFRLSMHFYVVNQIGFYQWALCTVWNGSKQCTITDYFKLHSK